MQRGLEDSERGGPRVVRESSLVASEAFLCRASGNLKQEDYIFNISNKLYLAQKARILLGLADSSDHARAATLYIFLVCNLYFYLFSFDPRTLCLASHDRARRTRLLVAHPATTATQAAVPNATDDSPVPNGTKIK